MARWVPGVPVTRQVNVGSGKGPKDTALGSIAAGFPELPGTVGVSPSR